MVKLRYIILLLFFLFLGINATSLVRPFEFDNWNYEREVEEAYESSYEMIDGVLINVDDSSKNIKAKKVLQKIEDLESYYHCLVNKIRDEIFFQVEDEFLREYGDYFDDDVFTETDNRFKQLIEIPMQEQFKKYRHRLLDFSSKSWIKNPDYTKLFIGLQIKEIHFVEDYLRQKLGIELGNVNGKKKPNGKGLAMQKSMRGRENSMPDSSEEKSYTRQRPSRLRSSSSSNSNYPKESSGSTDSSEEKSYTRQRPSRLSSSSSSNSNYPKESSSSTDSSEEKSYTRQRPSRLRSSSSSNSNYPKESSGSTDSSEEKSYTRQRPSRLSSSSQQAVSSNPPQSKNLQSRDFKKSVNIRPSSTRPGLGRPGRYIKEKFVRPVIRPLGERPVNLPSREKSERSTENEY